MQAPAKDAEAAVNFLGVGTSAFLPSVRGAVDCNQFAVTHDGGQHGRKAPQELNLTVVVGVPVRQVGVLMEAGRDIPAPQATLRQVGTHGIPGGDRCHPQAGIALGVLGPLRTLCCFALHCCLADLVAHGRQFCRRLVLWLASHPVATDVLAIVAKHATKAISKQFGPARFAWAEAVKTSRLQMLRSVAQRRLNGAKEVGGGVERDHGRRSFRNQREGAEHQTRSRSWLMMAAIITLPPGRAAAPTQARPIGH